MAELKVYGAPWCPDCRRSKAFLSEHRIDYDRIDKIRGLDVIVTTTAKTDEEGLALLKGFNFPFRN